MHSNRLEPGSETSRWTYSGCLWTAPYRDGGRQDDAVVDAEMGRIAQREKWLPKSDVERALDWDHRSARPL